MFTISLQPSGQTFQAEENEMLLDAGLRQGLSLSYGCRGGSCGACSVKIEQGNVDYPQGEPMGLSPYDRDQGYAFLCQATAQSDLVINAPQIKAETEVEVKTLPARVEKLRKLNHDVMEMTLKLPASEALRFHAGQYLDFLLPDNKRRSFSMSAAPAGDNFLELHIRHVEGGLFTDKVFSSMKEKDLVRIEAPLGNFYVHGDDRPMIFMAGGTGFAPIKAMLEQLFAQQDDRPMYLYWGVRAQADLYMDSIVKTWCSRHENLTYVPVLSEPEADWQGRKGWVHEAVLEDFASLGEYDIYMSGPPPMINAAKPAFLAQGADDDTMYSDSFEYSTDALEAIQTA